MIRVLIFIFSIINASGQSFQAPALLGMGNISAAYYGLHSTVANPAGIARQQDYGISIAYQRHYSLSDFNTFGAYGAIPILKNGSLAAQINQSQSSNFLKETTWGLNYSLLFGGRWSAALGFQQRRAAWQDIAVVATHQITAGVQYEHNNLLIGGYLKEIPIAKSSEAMAPSRPLEVLLGVSYLFSEQVYWATDIWWQQEESPELRTGLEYRFHRFYRLRGGISAQPVQYYLGAGLGRRHLHLDLAASIHRELGASPQLGLSYVF